MTATDTLLDFTGIGVRAVGFQFSLLDADHNQIGTLPTSEDLAPRVRNDTSRSVFRTLTGLSISASTFGAIDTTRDRVRPEMILANGAHLPLGVLMFGEDNRRPFSWGETWTPSMYDETLIVDDPLSQNVGLAPGGSILTLLAALVADAALPDVDLSGIADQTSSAALSYPVGASRNQAIVALAGLLGCYPPFFDNNGTYRLRAAPAAGAAADHSYGTGSRVIDGSVQISNTAYRAPNHYQVISGNPDSAIIGNYYLPDSAPNSAANRDGRIVTDSQTMQGLPTVELADLAAYINALRDRKSYTQASFDSTIDPRHDTFGLVDLYGIRYQEIVWEIECRPGGTMSHDLNGIYDA